MRFCLTLCWALLATYSTAQQCNLTIQGHIIDKDVNANLPNAVVEIVELGKQTLSDSSGNFLFKNICVGTYSIKVSHVSCETYMQTYTVSKSIHIDVVMPHSITVGGEAIVTAIKERQNTGIKKELAGQQLNSTKGENLATALSKLNGVTLLQTGSTVSKPVVNGLFGSRLLLINNGVRQEGQQWGNEHAPEVDPFLADKLTILKGVDELRYGSDAIGGVILVEPKSLSTTVGQSLNMYTGFNTNNRLYYGAVIYDKQLRNKPNLTYRLQGTYRCGANATTPQYRLNNTGIQEYNFSGAMRIAKQKLVIDFFASQFYIKLGIFTGSHIGNITDMQNAIAATKPSDVHLGELTYAIARPRQEVNHQVAKVKLAYTNSQQQKWNLLLAGQRNQRKEFDVVRSSSNTSPQLDLTVATLSQEINTDHNYIKNSNGTIGVVATQQFNNYSGRYFIPNYTAITNGIYALQKWSKHQWDWQVGIRADYKVVQTRRQKFNGQQVNYNFKFPTVAASANATYRINPHLKTNLAVALSSRAPYVNELLSDGIHHGTATYELGNIFLKTEKSLFVAWNWNYKSNNDKLQIELSLHNNSINDFIYQLPKPNEPVLTIAGAFPKITWQQTNARLTGSDINVQLVATKQLIVTHKNSLLYARNTSANDWLILMPANRMENSISYKLPSSHTFKNSNIGIGIQTVAKQQRVPNKGNIKYDFKEPPPGYTLLNAELSTTIMLKNKPMELFIGATNLLNKAYRDYLNTFRYYTDELGRNISVKLKYTI